MYVGFIDLEKSYDRVNKEALCQVLRMYDIGGKLLSGIKSMYVDSSACIRVKGGESEQFRIDSGVRQGSIMSVSLAVQCIYIWIDEDEDGVYVVLRMYDVVGKLLNGIKSMYVDSSACIRVKGGESEHFRIDSGVRQGCIMSVSLAVQCICIWIDEDGDGKKGSELPGGWRRVEIACR